VASAGRAFTSKKNTPATELTVPNQSGAEESKHLRHFVLFLLGADCVALFIYLLLVPANAWDSIASRLQAFGALAKSVGTVAASVIAYFSLKGVLRKYLRNVDTIFDQVYFASLVGLVSLIVWAAVLPIWRVELQVDPPQPIQPKVEIQGKTQALNELRDAEKAEKTTYILDGLLLRPYEVKIEGARDPLVLPLITVLKGSLIHRPLFVQLPCTLEVSPRMPGAEVLIRRTGEKDELPWGTLPSDGRVQLLPGWYDEVKFKYGNRVGSRHLEMKCPTTQTNISLESPEN
jgi:hypothetical protein